MVFIQGSRCITAHGDTSDTLDSLLLGKSALKKVPVLGDEGDEVPLALIHPLKMSNTTPRWLNSLVNAFPNLQDSKWGSYNRPIFFTSSNYGVDSLYAFSQDEDTSRKDFATTHGVIEKIRSLFGWGENFSIFSHACVSGGLGIDLASKALKDDEIDEALIFSFDFLSPFVTGGFHSLKILNGETPAPFSDREFGSIALGDGAAYCILSKQKSNIQLICSSLYNEMDSFTGNEETGSGFDSVLLPISKLSKGDLWIKGHGTGTLEAGFLESNACLKLFPDSPLVSWKGGIGHTLGSCAVVELAIAIEAISNGEAPGTVGAIEPLMNSNIEKDKFKTSDFNELLMLSNAFGGAHSALLVRYE